MNYESEDLNPTEREAFANLPREKVPPAALEDRVVQCLKQSALLSVTQPWWKGRSAYLAAGVAAALLFFALGALLTKWVARPPAAPGTPEFMLVLYQNPLQAGISRETEMKYAKEYGNWARDLTRQGAAVDGEKLKNDVPFVRIVQGHAEAAQNSNDKIAGFFLITASDYQQAIKIAETCPHAKYGGTVEVREIDHF